MSKKKDTWQCITDSLKSAVPKTEFHTWLSCLTPKQLDARSAVIEAPNKFVADWVEENYLAALRGAIGAHFPTPPQIQLTYSPTGGRAHRKEAGSVGRPAAWSSRQLPQARYTFSGFIVGKSNRFAHACARAVAENGASVQSPLFIFADLSVGKTHLVNALGNHLLSLNPATRVRCLSYKQFTADLNHAVRFQKINDFRESWAHCDCALIEDLHLAEDSKKLQSEVIRLMDLIAPQPVVITAKSAPGEIPNLSPRLRSRLEGGTLASIGPPEPEIKMAIIATAAKENGLTIPDDVAFFLANSTNDLKALNRHLVALQTYASLNRGEVDLSIAKWVIRNQNAGAFSVEEIQKLVAKYFNITTSQLLSNKKGRAFSYPRQLAMYLCRQVTGASFKELGKVFGNKDHSTVIYAVKRIERDRGTKNHIREDISRIQKLLA